MLDILFRQDVLEGIVIAGIFITIFGLFWRIVLIGAGLLLCFGVLANHEIKPAPTPVNEVKIIEEVNTTPAPIVIQVPEKVVIVDPRRVEYVRDCISYGFTKEWCEDNWDGKSVVKE